jgi:NADPH:quinone reductase-like Zn-dependent oxidoreductase
MRSWHLQGAALVEREMPRPAPGAGEVLVRVRAAGVTPTELGWYPTLHTKTGEKREGAVPSHEFAGEIAELGAEVAGFSAGQQIYGMSDWFADGALAEFCVTRPAMIAPMPAKLKAEEAASVPIGALTAWQGLFDRAQLQAGERILVHGGAGAVGVFAIQLARCRGARVIATVSARNVEFVRTLGADRVLDYRSAPFEAAVRDVDVVFDGVGGQTLERSWRVLKPGGRMVTIADDAGEAVDAKVMQAFFIVEPRGVELVEIGRLLDSGELRPVVDTVAAWDQAAAVYAGTVAKVGRGKVVIRVAR